MSGDRTTFLGPQMRAVVQAAGRVAELINERPTLVGGLAVQCQLTTPNRSTVDVDVVERAVHRRSHLLEVLSRAPGTEIREDGTLWIPTDARPVQVDVLIVNPAEIDSPSDDAGDRLHAFAHAWALDTATDHVIDVLGGVDSAVAVRIATPGPLVATKLQAITDRSDEKAGTDTSDIVSLVLDPVAGAVARREIAAAARRVRADIALHVEHFLVHGRDRSLDLLGAVVGTTLVADDLDLAAELILAATGSP